MSQMKAHYMNIELRNLGIATLLISKFKVHNFANSEADL